MGELTAEEFAQRAFDLNLIDERQVQEAWGSIRGRQVSGDEFRQLLERRELLTNFQSERMLRGERTGFFYGDYKVLYVVGTGTFARVYRAAHKTTGDIRALKVLRRKHMDDPEQSERFRREGEVGATLRHPNIVPIFEVVNSDEGQFLVMDFVEGRNLREFIKIRKKFDPLEATRLIGDVADGLAYAFGSGICHRDLKMSNVLVSSRGQAKLVDFGLAAADRNWSDEALADTQNPRTIDYAGLERATGVRRDDPRSDIYFLGCMYYHMLTGNAPIPETRDRTQRLSKTRFQNVMPVSVVDPTLPKAVVTIVGRAMELSPSLRYQSPAEMAYDLKTAMSRINEPEAVPVDEVVATDGNSAPRPPQVQVQRSLLVVESDVDLQNIFRERFKNSGYRVLLTRDPNLALARFQEDAKTADCVVFSTKGLGREALYAFNRFADNPITREIPAILLLGEKHQPWKAEAKLSKQRVVVLMPIKLRELRDLLAQLLPSSGISG